MRRIRIIGSFFIIVAAALMWSPHAFAAKFFNSMEDCRAALSAGPSESDFYTPQVSRPERVEDFKKNPKYTRVVREAPACVQMVVQFPERGKGSSNKVVLRKAGTAYYAELDANGAPLARGFEDGCANQVYAMESITTRPVAGVAPPQTQVIQQTQVVQIHVELQCSDGRKVAQADDCIQVSTAPRYVRVPVYVQEEVIYEEAYIPPPRYVRAPRYQEPYYADYGGGYGSPPITLNYTRNTNVNRNVNVNRNDNRNFNRLRDREPRDRCSNPLSRGCGTMRPTQTGNSGRPEFRGPSGNRPVQTGNPGGNQGGNSGRPVFR